MEPQLFSDIPVRVEILAGPLADHWPGWQGPQVFYYRIVFLPAMSLAKRDPRRQTYDTGTNEYYREYRQPLPVPPYSFEPYCVEPDQQHFTKLMLAAIDAFFELEPAGA